MTAVLVVVGAMVGAPLRYLTDLWIQSRHDSVMPWGTLGVNVTGSLVLGFVAAAVHGGGRPWLLTLIGVGLCGALTTFSTFGVETMRLIEDGSWLASGANVALSLVLGLVACTAGWALGAALV